MMIRAASLRFVFFNLLVAAATPAAAQFRDASVPFGFSGGTKAAFADFNNDGFTDLYAGKLWRNDRGRKFVPVEQSGPAQSEGTWADFDNDGKVDLFLYSGAGALYRNLGQGKFTAEDFPKLPTVNSRGAVWFDLDNDAQLDLYVGGYEIWQKAVHPDVLIVNQVIDGQRKFAEAWRTPENFSARGITSGDLNEDGFVDIFVSNYRLQPNFLLENRRSDKKSGRQLINVAREKSAAGKLKNEIPYTGGIKYPVSGHTIGSSIVDIDNDGHLDLFIGNFSHPRPGQDRPQFLKNMGPANNFRFEDRSADAGLAWQESYASPAFGDYDNDGDLDLFFTTVYAVGSGSIRNYPVLYENLGGWKFKDVTQEQGLSELPPTYQAAWADIDNDGDLDLCTAGKLFVNERRPDNTWLHLNLIGDGTKINRSAVGAIVRIKIGDQTLTRQITTGTGEGNQNDLRLHFGLGPTTQKSVTAEITWPDNRKQIIDDLEVNSIHEIRFGDE